jgi:hypothetical protein
MIRPDVKRAQQPTFAAAALAYRGFHCRTRGRIEELRGLRQRPRDRRLEARVRLARWVAEHVARSVDVSARVAWEPGAVTAEGDQVGEWAHA